MLFGIRLLGYLGNPSYLVRLAKIAEEVGFDFVWFPHDLFMDNSWVMTTAVGMVTERIKVATVGTNPYTTDPAEIASYIGTLDRLTNGRAVLGLGVHTTEMVAWVGHTTGNKEDDYERAMTRTKEAVQVLRQLFKGDVVDYKGQEFEWTSSCYLRFEPFRRDIPVYVAGFGERFHELTGAIGDGSLPMLTPPDAAKEVVEAIHRGARAAGRNPEALDIAGCAWISISKDGSATEKTMRRVVSYFGPYLNAKEIAKVGLTPNDFVPIRERLTQGDHDGASRLVTDKMLKLAIMGTPSECVEQIAQLQGAGVTHVSLGGPLGPDPEESIRLIGSEVIPQLRG